MRLSPWDYLFEEFNPHKFPDLFTPTWVVSLVLLAALAILYSVRTKRLHRHTPYLDLYEWLLWTGITLFGLLLTASLFSFDLILVLVIAVVGAVTLARHRRDAFIDELPHDDLPVEAPVEEDAP